MVCIIGTTVSAMLLLFSFYLPYLISLKMKTVTFPELWKTSAKLSNASDNRIELGLSDIGLKLARLKEALSYDGGAAAAVYTNTETRTYQRTHTHTRTNRSIFYFGITHSSTIRIRLESALKTWANSLKVVWYSDKPDQYVNFSVSAPEGNTYDVITWRVLLVWEHVYTHFPGYDWYVRVWEDNYIIRETFEALVDDHNPDDPVEIGRLGRHDGHVFIGGGASSLLSRAGMRIWSKGIDDCRKWLKSDPNRTMAYEDVWISMCRSKMGIRFVMAPGLYSHAPNHETVMKIDYSDIACRREKEYEHPHNNFKSVPRSFHYVTPDVMFSIHKALVNTSCDSNLVDSYRTVQWPVTW